MGRCLVAGHVNWDVTLRVDSLPPVDGEATIRDRHCGCGGSAANVAVGLAGLGVDVDLIGSVGDDECGRDAVATLEGAGVDCTGIRRIPDATTARKYLVVDESGAVSVLGDDGANEAVGPSDVDPVLVRRADHVHLTGNRPETTGAIASLAAEAGVSVSYDPGRQLTERSIEAPIDLVDVLFLSSREADAVRATAAGERAFGERTVVVTDGDDGAVVHAPDATYRHAGFDVDTTDTSGAGDAFVAGFLTNWLQDGDVERALRVGNACGALATRTVGAQSSLSPQRLESLLADCEM
ncbi:sugar kinase, ribokinase [Halovivax ruber XH-70]|uniref:Sugar kinase, ribokinase n=1 Tax=Halovivax ruber (strain DSM 18193 / JCM 13892 / XH-70) TaxID=797302 RepID=L0I9E7_HALRX|nr:carbohydrate kinase family protein [Halovivax ruber]AGB15443.1 sugar kinase, ribokinase [Halovivax ruber XH-70]